MSNFFKHFPQTLYDFERNGNIRTVTDIFRSVRAYSSIDDFVGYIKYDILDGERPDQVSFKLYDNPNFYWTFFMINEELSRGLIDWPKGYGELERLIDLKYTGTVMTFFRSSDDAQLNDHYVYNNFVAGERIFDEEGGTQVARVKSVDTVMNRIYLDTIDNTLYDLDSIYAETSEKTIASNENYSWSIEAERLAAHHYEDANGDIVDRIYFTDSGEQLTEVTNQEYERDANDLKRSIKVIKPDKVSEFVQAYKGLINA